MNLHNKNYLIKPVTITCIVGVSFLIFGLIRPDFIFNIPSRGGTRPSTGLEIFQAIVLLIPAVVAISILRRTRNASRVGPSKLSRSEIIGIVVTIFSISLFTLRLTI